jgi:hypothetical protein
MRDQERLGAEKAPRTRTVKAVRKPAGGFALVSVMKLSMVWWAFRAKLLRASDLRVYFACHLAVAARCRTGVGREPRFTHDEIARSCGVEERSIRSSLRRLETSGLLTWSDAGISFASSPDNLPLEDLSGFWAMFEKLPNRKRLVPVPRRILRLMTDGASSNLIATILGHLIRCLYYWPDEGCRSHGSCKSSWIASVFGISLRGAKSARKELLALGFLIRKESPQWRLNRLGLELEINLEWPGVEKRQAEKVGPPKLEAKSREPEAPSEPEEPAAASGHEFAPPPAQNCTAFAPPESDKELSYGESKNQKPSSGGSPSAKNESGDCISNQGTEKTKAKDQASGEAPPILRNVVLADLRDTGRLLELLDQAVEAKLIGGSERERLLFVGAAEHARSIGKGNPCGLFIHLVKGKLWHFLTAEDEDRANARLKAHLFGKPRESEPPRSSTRESFSAPSSAVSTLSDDARLVRAVRTAAAQAGFKGDAFYLLRRERPEWTRERWDAAVGELARPTAGSRRAEMSRPDFPKAAATIGSLNTGEPTRSH